MSRIIFLLAAVTLSGAMGSAQVPGACDTPLTETAIKELVSGGVPAARLRTLISTCGIDIGQPDLAATDARLRSLGVAPAALTALAPPTPAAAGTSWMSPIDRRNMVFVPAGEFRMGSDPAEARRDADETPHTVSMAGFWIDTDEVTNEAFRRFLIARPEWQRANVGREAADGNYLRGWDGVNYPAGTGNQPVGWVSWFAARSYAAWAGKRLPTEAEWEYAARVGSTTRFWWGDTFDPSRVAGASGRAEARTNVWGVRDMTGGVWEWTATLYRPYPYVATDGREDASVVGPRVTRGGSRANGEAFLRTANRNQEEVLTTSDLLGFRCVR